MPRRPRKATVPVAPAEEIARAAIGLLQRQGRGARATVLADLGFGLDTGAHQAHAGTQGKRASSGFILLDIPERRGFLGSVREMFSRPLLRPFVAAATAFLMLFSLYMVSPNKSLINKTIRRQIQAGVSQLEKLYVKAGALTDNIGEFANNVFTPAKTEASRGRSDAGDKL